MRPQVILLNGGSSAGKTTLARQLQERLPAPWLALGVDTFIGTLPPRLTAGGHGIGLAADGAISVGAEFTRLETCWMRGVAAMAAAGARLIVDDAFLSGPSAQRRWRHALDGLAVLWVGVHCAPAEAERRESARADRVRGMARAQALAVHRGISYNLEVDTTGLDVARAAAPIVEAAETPA